MMIQVGSSSAMPMSFTIWGWSSFFISTAGRPCQAPCDAPTLSRSSKPRTGVQGQVSAIKLEAKQEESPAIA